jgi:hypothetical protein
MVSNEGDMVKKIIVSALIFIPVFSIFMLDHIQSQVVEKNDCFFLSSLHYTTEGMRYWYSKDTGGLETVTGIPYDELKCKNCHAAGCDRCHKSEEGSAFLYSTSQAKKQNLCLECHGRAAARIGIDQKAGQVDVHINVRLIRCIIFLPMESLSRRSSLKA